MDVEASPDLVRRAARHAALGDPARLAIVDALRVGDASPSELARLLDLPSNLLAHHLNTLATSGLVSRRRSEGDGRRTYLRLRGEALADLAPAPAHSAERIVFVCTANSARSHLAAALWRRASEVPATSAGTHPADAIAPGARATAARHDLDLPPVAPQHVDDVRVDTDLLITVCDRAHEELGEAADLHWSVPDPVPLGTRRAFDAAHDELSTRIHDAARLLTPA